MSARRSDLEPFDAIDAEIVSIARSINILGSLTWPRALESRFLEGWRAGRPELPSVEHAPADHRDKVAALESIMSRCDRADPMGDHLYKTAWSYGTALRMLQAVGTPEFTEHSVRLYGRPDYVYERQKMSVVDAARPILEVTEALQQSDTVLTTTPDTPAEEFAEQLRGRLDDYFTQDRVEVVVDPAMSAKAAAGAKRVRIQAGALFSDLDLAQLLNHEAFIHAATSLSGRQQPHLRVLGLGSPRTTRTQEGLAVFSELITYSIDLVRLRRVALRAMAVDAALAGADFIDVFRIYLDGGQSESDAYNSAQRVFRGGDVRGRVAFTKDAAYLEGLLLVQTFLRKAIADERPELIPILFAGRMTLGDVIELEPLFAEGVLVPARYLPDWIRGLRQLSAYLAYSLVSGRIRMELVELPRFLELEDAVLA
ncbi:MAG: flavohemoglobin expression-modulating QEGLA motif protein [Candidatus Limnocylindrales bacterium]